MRRTVAEDACCGCCVCGGCGCRCSAGTVRLGVQAAAAAVVACGAAAACWMASACCAAADWMRAVSPPAFFAPGSMKESLVGERTLTVTGGPGYFAAEPAGAALAVAWEATVWTLPVLADACGLPFVSGLSIARGLGTCAAGCRGAVPDTERLRSGGGDCVCSRGLSGRLELPVAPPIGNPVLPDDAKDGMTRVAKPCESTATSAAGGVQRDCGKWPAPFSEHVCNLAPESL